jgi:hypothetical protein
MNSKNTYRVFGLGGRIVYLALAVALAYFLFTYYPIKFELLVGKATYAALGAILAYFIDVLLFPNYRLNDLAKHKDEPEYAQVIAAAQVRRALIVIACVLGICLGL